MRLANDVAVITGAAAGIDFAHAWRLLAKGARVVVPGAAGRALRMPTGVGDAGSARGMIEGTDDPRWPRRHPRMSGPTLVAGVGSVLADLSVPAAVRKR